MSQPVERLREIWTPNQEVLEVSADTEPKTELDSILRAMLHRVVQQQGPFTLDMNTLNKGTLRWELVSHGLHSEISIWVE